MLLTLQFAINRIIIQLEIFYRSVMGLINRYFAWQQETGVVLWKLHRQLIFKKKLSYCIYQVILYAYFLQN